MFRNSKLPPNLPNFSTTLPAWSMVCRAAQGSLDCYDSRAPMRRGTYTPANTSKDIKAMIIDDQLIDDSRLVIVSIRGTEFSSLSDWSVNKAADPVQPTGFLDDEENACHAGFLNVTKAMVNQVATQLQQLPASVEKPSLLFTGHSAGGAVAALLYSHMTSTSVSSELTALASLFPSINCITFGAPPLSLTPLPKRDHAAGIFLSFANEGDPVLRLSNAAYVKSLAKLMTASPPSSVVAPAVQPVKVVRGSRGTRVIRTVAPLAPPTPWEELPLWPTPPAPLTNAGDVILLRDRENGSASASRVADEELADVIFGDLAQHTIEMYMRRIKEVAFDAMMGRNVF
ncbi:alpha/beta-hydrolase [Setomelanomma holmii]|uniref:Alpha/beta-hydrolase n=1 Tax=Setomelanomma holmii TaxID=210430 RepID=A0A9P4HFN7_9PLEO|nr:alpha/beta-hydrolase [Setomelanomma holmii]